MKQQIKALLYRLAPRWMTAIQSARARAHSHRIVAEWGGPEVARKLVERFGSAVLSGPFQGLVLTEPTMAEQIGPYLLGLYESELDPAWEFVFAQDYPLIVDIGAKFGFYAVGLARRYPESRVVAFDTDWWARRVIRGMCRENRVGNVEVGGFCDAGWLMQNVKGRAFVLSDCEGYEDVLFSPEVAMGLSEATVLVETHDCLVAGVSDRLRVAFSKTHRICEFGEESVRRGSAAPINFLSEAEQRLASREVRGAQRWLLCLPLGKIGQLST